MPKKKPAPAPKPKPTKTATIEAVDLDIPVAEGWKQPDAIIEPAQAETPAAPLQQPTATPAETEEGQDIEPDQAIDPSEPVEEPPDTLKGTRGDLPPRRCPCKRVYRPGYLFQKFCWTCKRHGLDEVPTDDKWRKEKKVEWEGFLLRLREATLEGYDVRMDEEQDYSFGDYGIIRCTPRIRLAAELIGMDEDPKWVEVKTEVPVWKLLALNSGEEVPSKFPHMVQYFAEKHLILKRSRRLREMRQTNPPTDPSKLVDFNIELGKLEDSVLKMRHVDPVANAAKRAAIRDLIPTNRLVDEFVRGAALRALRYQLGCEPKR